MIIIGAFYWLIIAAGWRAKLWIKDLLRDEFKNPAMLIAATTKYNKFHMENNQSFREYFAQKRKLAQRAKQPKSGPDFSYKVWEGLSDTLKERLPDDAPYDLNKLRRACEYQGAITHGKKRVSYANTVHVVQEPNPSSSYPNSAHKQTTTNASTPPNTRYNPYLSARRNRMRHRPLHPSYRASTHTTQPPPNPATPPNPSTQTQNQPQPMCIAHPDSFSHYTDECSVVHRAVANHMKMNDNRSLNSNTNNTNPTLHMQVSNNNNTPKRNMRPAYPPASPSYGYNSANMTLDIGNFVGCAFTAPPTCLPQARAQTRHQLQLL
eukprot:comp24135_c4_seq2/m.43853 comp24135_c4_seq2/g.43853  ORF comp24135_c4_seq2/g.43853 comp24135_c4_seq2/m.43853 type:complete len:321 (+) comp24135_c4_seq2:45-1007(+)